ncbi:MAG: radical SAM protein, partial [Flavobacteriales bacterium]|nr:radical SAM protein [Flavobacteriales bacterium]MDW8411036.1 radical SAM protein [Flavobacteriales bacterium]
MAHLPPSRGRGSPINPGSRFVAHRYEPDGDLPSDTWEDELNRDTRLIPEHPKRILNPVISPDLPDAWGLNPYQGCEHGCVYCYARPTHEYYGYSAGLDFESIIHYKPNAPELFEKEINRVGYKVKPLMLSGNTDCYQPAERQLQLTRKILEICLQYNHPVGIITKNALVLRDLDVLVPLASKALVHVNISLTTLNEDLRRKMEPRTATGQRRLETISRLSAAGVPVRCLIGPVIPFLNSQELPQLLKSA